MIEFYQQLEHWLATGDVAMATVIHITGSVPREVGAKMLIRANGEIRGTIGGGAGEAKVIQQAIALLHASGDSQGANRNAWVDIDLSGASQRDTQGVCGGSMRVWVECWTKECGGAIAHHLHQCLSQGRSATLVTPCLPNHPPYLAGTERLSCPQTEQPNGSGNCLGVILDPFVERIAPPPTLLIIGAGHVGIALAHAAEFAGFQVVVHDDRPEFADSSRFSPHVQVMQGAIAPALQQFSWPDDLYIALVTRGIAVDLEALAFILHHAIQQPPRYIGMIGSLKRIRHVMRELQHRGLSQMMLDSLYAPIGIDIGALTPEEIAISICAELIQVRRCSQAQRSHTP